MADEEDGAGVGGQLPLEPGDGVDVEVVGGLVEHEHVGLASRSRARATRIRHPPESSTGPAPVGLGEAEAGEHPLGLGLEGVAAEVLEGALGLAEVPSSRSWSAPVVAATRVVELLEAVVEVGDVRRRGGSRRGLTPSGATGRSWGR